MTNLTTHDLLNVIKDRASNLQNSIATNSTTINNDIKSLKAAVKLIEIIYENEQLQQITNQRCAVLQSINGTLETHNKNRSN